MKTEALSQKVSKVSNLKSWYQSRMVAMTAMAAMIIPPATVTEDTQAGTPLPASGDEVVTAVYEYGCEQY